MPVAWARAASPGGAASNRPVRMPDVPLRPSPPAEPADPSGPIRDLLAGVAPLLWISTDDEGHALSLVRQAAMALGRDVMLWDVVRGVRDGLIEPAAAEQGTEHPAAALLRLARLARPAVCVMCDLSAHLDDARTLRAARDLVARFADPPQALAGSALVLIDHRDELPAVLRAAATPVPIPPPGDEEIRGVVSSTLRRINKVRRIEARIGKKDLDTIVSNLRGLSRAQVERVVTGCVWEDRKFCADDLRMVQQRKREAIRAEGLLEFVDAPTSMDEIGGLARLKQWLRQRERALLPEAQAFGLEAPRGVLMLGVQGAGKSLCAKAIATAWKRPLLRLDPSVLYDRYIGESERRLRDALRQAELMAPVVLWIDEIEKGFASAASHSIDGGLSQRMFGTLLTWMQDHRHPVFLAATANDVEAMPPELLRKGRFDEIFFVDLPGDAARRAIFEIHLRRRGRDAGRFDLDALAQRSAGYSGAEIEQAVKSALHEAFSAKAGGGELTTDLLVRTLEGSPPLSVTMGERIARLRRWAQGRCVPAE